MPRIIVGTETTPGSTSTTRTAARAIGGVDPRFALLQRRRARRHPDQRAGQVVTAHAGPHNVARTPQQVTQAFLAFPNA
jgi:hypothetical protein